MLEEDRNFLGQTPLHLASVNRDISSLLLDAGHSIDTTDKHGITPLMYAAGMGNSEVVQMLILRGADTTISDTRWGRNSSHMHPYVVIGILSSNLCKQYNHAILGGPFNISLITPYWH
jgi:hypothetical protein